MGRPAIAAARTAVDVAAAAVAAAAAAAAVATNSSGPNPDSVVANADSANTQPATTTNRKGVSFAPGQQSAAATARSDRPRTMHRHHHQSLDSIALPPLYTDDDDDDAPEQDPAQLEGVNNITSEGESVLHFYILRKPRRTLDFAARGSPKLINRTYTGKN
ncbi:hypothetical protein DFJ73DRAFT_756394 [Zopfochytrium polystomum]|nr:hypothetical protein DFJ73DRAFT_756394 [Zopfochytrium polystomum]